MQFKNHILKNVSLVFAALIILTKMATAQSVSFQLDFPNPETHYVSVKMEVSDVVAPYVDLRLPTWAPGSYMIREFSRNVDSFKPEGDLKFEKIAKETWRVYTNNATKFTVKYEVYALELTVRTSYIDQNHAYLNGTSVFMYVDGKLDIPQNLKVVPHSSWKKVSTGLTKVDEKAFTFSASDYDFLVDCPIEIGNHKTFTFQAAGIPHHVAIYGDVKYKESKVVEDFTKIIETTKAIFPGAHPCKDYTIIIHHMNNGSGGLEHLNSTTLQAGLNAYSDEKTYRGLLRLLAHEYFHLWNVKRIRPETLGPFDYSKENYTRMLWFSEGLTSYYDKLIPFRAGYDTPEEFLSRIGGSLNVALNNPGDAYQSLAESSLEAWIKFYLNNENSRNVSVSYYTKGSVVAALLDIQIRSMSNNTKSMDDVLRKLWQDYQQNPSKGFSEETLLKTIEEAAGGSLQDFYAKYLYGTTPIDYTNLFKPAGLKATNLDADLNAPYTGLSVNRNNFVFGIDRNSPAWTSGISYRDEIIEVNGQSKKSYNEVMAETKVGETLKIKVKRDDGEFTYKVKVGKSTAQRVLIETNPQATEAENAVKKSWLGK